MALDNNDLCLQPGKLQTIYNENPLVPAYPGIMFDFTPLFEGVVTSLEVDVRLDEATMYDIEIFSSEGTFLKNMTNQTAWVKHADTVARVAPGGDGLIVSERDFLPLKVKPLQKHSFYIQMKGPWIDVRAYALEKTGEVQEQSDDMVVFVGVGLNSRFAEDFDKTIDPQFGGVVHYRKEIDCADADDEYFTEVPFPILLPHKPDPVFLSQVKKAVDGLVQDKLLKAAPFHQMVSEYNLKIRDTTEIITLSSELECPTDWSFCPDVALNTIMSFSHKKGLRSGQINFQLYRMEGAIVEELRKRLDVEGAAYVGLRPVAASFEINLAGAPINWTGEAKEFFEQVTTGHLNDMIGDKSDFVNVLDTLTFKQASGRRLRGLSGESSLSGTVVGAQGIFLPSQNFAIQLNNAFAESKATYLDTLTIGQYSLENLGTISSFAFGDITGVQAKFLYEEATGLTLEPADSARGAAKALLIPTCIILVLFVCFSAYYGPKKMKERKEYKKSLEEYREDMRTSRRSKRDELSRSGEAESTADSLSKSFTNELDAAFELGYDAYKKHVETCGLSALSAHQLVDEESSLPRSGSTHGAKLDRSSAHRSLSSHSLKIKLEQEFIDSDLDDHLSVNSFEDDSSVASAEKSVVSRASQASSKSGRSLLSVFMEKQAEKQEQLGLHMNRTPSVASGATRNSRCSSVKADPLRSRSEHLPRTSHSYLGGKYAPGRPERRVAGSSRVGGLDSHSDHGSGSRKTLAGYFDKTGERVDIERSLPLRSKSLDRAYLPRPGSLDSRSDHSTLSQNSSTYTGRRIYLAPVHSDNQSVSSTRSERSENNSLERVERADLANGKKCENKPAHSSSSNNPTNSAIPPTTAPTLASSFQRRESRTISPGSQDHPTGVSRFFRKSSSSGAAASSPDKTKDDSVGATLPLRSSGGVLPNVAVFRQHGQQLQGLEDFLDSDPSESTHELDTPGPSSGFKNTLTVTPKTFNNKHEKKTKNDKTRPKRSSSEGELRGLSKASLSSRRKKDWKVAHYDSDSSCDLGNDDDLDIETSKKNKKHKKIKERKGKKMSSGKRKGMARAQSDGALDLVKESDDKTVLSSDSNDAFPTGNKGDKKKKDKPSKKDGDTKELIRNTLGWLERSMSDPNLDVHSLDEYMELRDQVKRKTPKRSKSAELPRVVAV